MVSMDMGGGLFLLTTAKQELSSVDLSSEVFYYHSGYFIFPDRICSCMQIRCGTTAIRKISTVEHTTEQVRPQRENHRDINPLICAWNNNYQILSFDRRA